VNPQVRLWTVRLQGDAEKISPQIASRLTILAQKETDIEVCCQLASSARRLPTADCLPIVRGLLTSQNAEDARLPLLVWWAIESKAAADAGAIVTMLEDQSIWKAPIMQRYVTERIMRRFAATDQRKDLTVCAKLLSLAPNDDDVKRLMSGFEAAYAGRPLVNLPSDLAAALEKFSGSSVTLGLRQGRAAALEEALKTLTDDRADKTKQLQYVQILGEVSQPECVPTLLNVVTKSSDSALQTSALRALGRYDSPQIAPTIIGGFSGMTDDVRAAAGALLASRASWIQKLLEAIDARQFDKSWLPLDVVQRMTLFSDRKIFSLVNQHWPDLKPATSEQLKTEIDRIAAVLQNGVGKPKAGKQLFMNQCGKCHTLFAAGGKVGPDLTTFKRDDLQTMLLSIVNPNAEIREGFNTYRIEIEDGRLVSGTLAEQDSQTVTLRTPEGTLVSVARGEIAEMKAAPQSIMPEGLLKEYSDQQLRDLFGYLRMTQPVID
jgi:putative heme-binding domain-containing protein